MPKATNTVKGAAVSVVSVDGAHSTGNVNGERRPEPTSSSPPYSPFRADTDLRPVLTHIEMNRARSFGRVRQAELGEILYRPGEEVVPCFILLSVSLEIVQPSIHGERFVFTLSPGMFTGGGHDCRTTNRSPGPGYSSR